jgi:hypothetical protein
VLKTGVHRGAFAAVLRVMHHLHCLVRHLVDDCVRSIGGSIIDDDDLEILGDG